MVDDITFIKLLGKGSFGEVYLSSKTGFKELFATKKIDKKYANAPNMQKYFHNEVGILREVHHKNIMKLIDFKETRDHYYLVCELCNGGSLTECLDKYRKMNRTNFPEKIVQHLMRQIVDAIRYLHERKIIHRDLKLDNILVNFETEADKSSVNMLKAQAKIIDFGFATKIGAASLAYSTLGSPINMDPLMLKKLNKLEGKKGYDEKVDIWSLGTVCYEMLIGKSTFDAVDMRDLVNKVERGTYTLPPNLSTEAVSFLNAMLQYDGKMRLNAKELSRHHFLVKNINEFKPIDLSKVRKNIDRNGNLKINVKQNQSIWDIFNENETLAEVPGYRLVEDNNALEVIPENGNFQMNKNLAPTSHTERGVASKINNFFTQHMGGSPFQMKNNIGGNQYGVGGANYGAANHNMGFNNNFGAGFTGNNANNFGQQKPMNNNFGMGQKNEPPKVNEQSIKNEIAKALEEMNDDFLYIEPLFIPLVPGNDPTVINPNDEYNDDETF